MYRMPGTFCINMEHHYLELDPDTQYRMIGLDMEDYYINANIETHYRISDTLYIIETVLYRNSGTIIMLMVEHFTIDYQDYNGKRIHSFYDGLTDKCLKVFGSI